MGYTHYWYKVKELPKNKWELFLDDFSKLIHEAKFGDLIEGGIHGEAYQDDIVDFNGIGEEAHENFYFPRVEDTSKFTQYQNGKIFNFCKTARKEYDPVVCSALIVAKKHFGSLIDISSDGSNEAEMWHEAKEYCQNTLGYGAQFEFSNQGNSIFRRKQKVEEFP